MTWPDSVTISIGKPQDPGNFVRGIPMHLGAAYLSAGKGGISRVARLTARALLDAGAELEMTSLLDEAPITIEGKRARACAGQLSKLKFAWACSRAALQTSASIYDQAGLARAHIKSGPLRRPFAVWMHGIEVWEQLRPEVQASIARADFHFLNSHFTLERFQKLHGPLPNADVCWLGTEADEAPAHPADFLGPPTALLLARIDDLYGFKGHGEMVDLWPKVISSFPAARLLIAGGGAALSRMREHAARSPAAANIDVIGFVPEDQMDTVWQRAHVLAMPSRKEGFGLVYIEAMRHGIPVIASTQDAGCEINVHGETGFNIDLDRPDELADALIASLRDATLAHKLGRAGQDRWRRHFRYSAFAERFAPLASRFLQASL